MDRYRPFRLLTTAWEILRRQGPRPLIRRFVGWLRGERHGSAFLPVQKLPGENWDFQRYTATPRSYQRFITDFEPDIAQLYEQIRTARTWTHAPTITIVTYIPPHILPSFDKTVQSVINQTDERWEWLCLGTDVHLPLDERIRHISIPSSRIAALKQGLEHATGDWVLFLAAGDVLAPHALYQIAKTASENAALDFIYSDEDQIDARGRRHNAFMKPGWSPEMLLSTNYIGALAAFRRELYQHVGELNTKWPEVFLWEFYLRLTSQSRQISRISQVLYHRHNTKRTDGSKIGQQACQMLVKHLDNVYQRPADVVITDDQRLRVQFQPLPKSPFVSIVILSKGADEWLERCVTSLLQTTAYAEYEIVIVNNGPQRPEAFPFYQSIASDARINIQHDDRPFNYGAANNYGATIARGEVLLFLNNDTVISDPDWLTEMVQWIVLPEIGTVGAKLLFPNGTIQHIGAAVGLHGVVGHPFAGEAPDTHGVFGSANWYRNWLAVTGACVMVCRSVFDRIGGFNERFTINGSDIALGVSVHEYGLRNIVTPYARLTHHESVSVKGNQPAQDDLTALERLAPYMSVGDPYYNPNLSHWQARPQLRQLSDPNPFSEVIRKVSSYGLTWDVIRPEHRTWEHHYSHHARQHIMYYRAITGSRQHRSIVSNEQPIDVNTVAWFVDIDQFPLAIEAHQILSLASHLSIAHQITGIFAVPAPARQRLLRALPLYAGLEPHNVHAHTSFSLPSVDAAIATDWMSAYELVQFNQTKRKLYWRTQDELSRYPAGSVRSLIENAITTGLWGVCTSRDVCRQHPARTLLLSPVVTTDSQHATPDHRDNRPYRVLLAGNPDNPTTGFELAAAALVQLKQTTDEKIEIWVTSDVDIPSVYQDWMTYMPMDDYSNQQPYWQCDAILVLSFAQQLPAIIFEGHHRNLPVVTNRQSGSCAEQLADTAVIQVSADVASISDIMSGLLRGQRATTSDNLDRQTIPDAAEQLLSFLRQPD